MAKHLCHYGWRIWFTFIFTSCAPMSVEPPGLCTGKPMSVYFLDGSQHIFVCNIACIWLTTTCLHATIIYTSTTAMTQFALEALQNLAELSLCLCFSKHLVPWRKKRPISKNMYRKTKHDMVSWTILEIQIMCRLIWYVLYSRTVCSYKYITTNR